MWICQGYSRLLVPSENCVGIVLTTETAMDFRDLLNSLLPKAAKWNSIGIQLGLSTDELDTIRANCIDVEECLRKVLQKWHDKTLNPTWREVITALRSPSLEEMRLAKDLEHKMVIAISPGLGTLVVNIGILQYHYTIIQ